MWVNMPYLDAMRLGRLFFYLHERLTFMVNVGKYSVHRSYGNCVETWWVGKNWHLSAMLNFKCVLAWTIANEYHPNTCVKQNLLLFSSIVIDITDITCFCFFGAGCDALETNPAPSDICNFWASPHFQFSQYAVFFCIFTVSFLYITIYTYV